MAVVDAGQNLRFSHNGVIAKFLTQVIGYVHRSQGFVIMVNCDGRSAVGGGLP